MNSESQVPSEKGQNEERARSAQPTFAPRADILEDSEKVTILLDMPGVGPEGLEVNLDQDTLSVEGRMEVKMVANLKLAHREFGAGTYRRTFTISNAVDRDRIAASIKHGVVELTLPKKEELKPKKIPVR